MTSQQRTTGLVLSLFLALAMLATIPLIDYWAAALLAAVILTAATFMATLLMLAETPEENPR